jgi:hypothetical protein
LLRLAIGDGTNLHRGAGHERPLTSQGAIALEDIGGYIEPSRLTEGTRAGRRHSLNNFAEKLTHHLRPPVEHKGAPGEGRSVA